MAQLIDEARTAFLERGVEGTAIEDLRRATGKSVGSIYHRFRSKEGFAAAVYAEALAGYQSAVIDELRRHPGAEAGVRAVVGRHLDWHRSDPGRARFLHQNGGLASREPGRSLVAELNRGFFDEALRWWRTHVAYGAVRDLPFDLAYVLWLGAAQEYCRLSLAGVTRIGVARAKRTLAQGAWDSLKTERS